MPMYDYQVVGLVKTPTTPPENETHTHTHTHIHTPKTKTTKSWVREWQNYSILYLKILGWISTFLSQLSVLLGGLQIWFCYFFLLHVVGWWILFYLFFAYRYVDDLVCHYSHHSRTSCDSFIYHPSQMVCITPFHMLVISDNCYKPWTCWTKFS